MVKQHVTRTVIFAILGLAIGLGIAFFSPKIYEARTQLLIGVQNVNQQNGPTYGPDVDKILSTGSASNTTTETQILGDKSILAQAIYNVDPSKGADSKFVDRMFDMYDALTPKESTSVSVIVRAEDPKFAEEVAAQIPIVYNERRKYTTKESVRNAAKYLQAQLDTAKGQVDKAQSKIRQFKEKNNMTEYSVKVSNLNSEVTATQKTVEDLQAAEQAMMSEMAVQQTQLANLDTYSKTGLQRAKSQAISQVEQTLTQLQTQRAGMVARYYADHPDVVQIDATIKSLQANLTKLKKNDTDNMEAYGDSEIRNPIRESISAQYTLDQSRIQNVRSQLRSYKALLEKQQAELNTIPAKEEALTNLMRDLQTQDTQYRKTKAILEDIQSRSEVAPDAAQIVFPAKALTEPVAPNPPRYAFVGLVGGLALGLLFSFFLESFRLRVYTSAQLATLTGTPVAATVPLLPRPTARRMLTGLIKKDATLIESFRFMAFSLLGRGANRPKRMLFTSNGDNAGCSTSAAQLAASLARTGVSVLLVDANLQKPSISAAFGVQDKPGVSDILDRAMLPSQGSMIGYETEQPNLRVLPAGTMSPNEVKEVSTAAFEGFLNVISSQADMVIIDTPPCNVMSDASRIVPYVDEVFLVVSASSASARNVPSAQEILVRSGAAKISLILTHASPEEEAFSRQRDYLLSNQR